MARAEKRPFSRSSARIVLCAANGTTDLQIALGTTTHRRCVAQTPAALPAAHSETREASTVVLLVEQEQGATPIRLRAEASRCQ
jgi:hypothetical protein